MAMIDSDKLYRRIAGHSKYSGDAILTAISCLAEGKEIHDVPWLKNYVKVVRCRDCTHYAKIQGELKGECLLHGYGREDFIVESDDFCSCGKRRE